MNFWTEKSIAFLGNCCQIQLLKAEFYKISYLKGYLLSPGDLPFPVTFLTFLETVVAVVI